MPASWNINYSVIRLSFVLLSIPSGQDLYNLSDSIPLGFTP